MIEPVHIIEESDRKVSIKWSDETETLYSAAQLRRSCPCASCINEWTGEKILDDARIPDNAGRQPVDLPVVRGGKVVERMELVTAEPRTAAEGTEGDVLQAALQHFYADRVAPPDIHLPVAFSEADAEMLEAWLSGVAQRRVRIVVPKRGEKRGLLELAARNAAVAYQARFNETVAARSWTRFMSIPIGPPVTTP